MVRVVLYGIVSEGEVMERWVCREDRQRLNGFEKRLIERLGGEAATTIRTVRQEDLWVYYFRQQGFLFLLAAEGDYVALGALSAQLACKTTYAS